MMERQADGMNGASEGGAAASNGASSLQPLRLQDRRTNEGLAAQAECASELVLFRNGDASLRIERGADDMFELVLSVHGEEVTAYDLTAETVATIGKKLLSAAAHS